MATVVLRVGGKEEEVVEKKRTAHRGCDVRWSAVVEEVVEL